MAKNISLLGANYQDVPAVTLPQTGGGSAMFVDPDDLFIVDIVTESYTIAGNNTYNFHLYNLANVKTGYTPIGVVGYTTNNSNVIAIGVMLVSGQYGNYGGYLKNLSSSSITGSFSASILYKKN